MRPAVMKVNPKRVVWLDTRTGKGVTLDNRAVSTVIKSRRKTPALDDLLDTAAQFDAEWIMLTGPAPKAPPGVRAWIDTPTPNWEHGNHFRGDDPRGRYLNSLTGQKVEINMASGWFGKVPLTPIQAQRAWTGLRYYLNKVEPNMTTPLMSPGLTGAMLWAYSVNERKGQRFDPMPIDPAIAELLHATSGQHHMEHLVAGPDASEHPDFVSHIDPVQMPTISEFARSDGRFMYAAHCAELGVGPARQLTRAEAGDLWFHEQGGKYAKARYRVKFTVPHTWPHIGILGMQETDNSTGWYYPNRPGATGETWADHRELIVAERFGWIIEPLEAIRFTEKTRPLDTFAERIKRLRREVSEAEGVEPVLVQAITGALRNILIHGIGRFMMRGQEVPMSADTFDGVPADAVAHEVNGRWVYKGRVPLSDTEKTRYHPELAAQVWGWSRAQVLSHKAANGKMAGALHVDPRTLLGIEGDAIYTSAAPPWALPVEHGGGDDGKEGRIRLQGFLQGEMKTPVTKDQRDVLKKKADAAGPSAAWEV